MRSFELIRWELSGFASYPWGCIMGSWTLSQNCLDWKKKCDHVWMPCALFWIWSWTSKSLRGICPLLSPLTENLFPSTAQLPTFSSLQSCALKASTHKPQVHWMNKSNMLVALGGGGGNAVKYNSFLSQEEKCWFSLPDLCNITPSTFIMVMNANLQCPKLEQNWAQNGKNVMSLKQFVIWN